MSAPGYVPNDGFTEDGTLSEVPGLYPALKFSFRRLTAAEFGDYMQAAEKLSEKQAAKLIAAHLAGRIKSWDLADGKGGVLPITADNMGRLVRALFSRLWKIIAGLEAPDTLGTAADEDAEFQAALAAAQGGKSVIETREEADRKN